jgi:hypothetical protein
MRRSAATLLVSAVPTSRRRGVVFDWQSGVCRVVRSHFGSCPAAHIDLSTSGPVFIEHVLEVV